MAPIVSRDRVALTLSVTLAAVLSAAAASANDCHSNPPRMTGVSEARTNCVPNCGFIIAHWSGPRDCDHYNIRERSGKQFEAPGTDRNQLYNQRSAQFPGRFAPGNTIHVAVQGCTKPIIGSSHCTNWSQEVNFFVDDGSRADAAKQRACRNYASRAVTLAKFVRDNHCDPKIYSGPRWSSDFNEHLRWCMSAAPATANAEDRERTRLSEECRKGPPAGPKGGTPQISVRSQAGDTFFINGSGFPPNSPVIIRLTGPGAAISAVTVVNNERLVSDKNGSFSIRLFGAQICKRGGGTINFSAEDQDRPQKATATSKCAP